VVRSHRRLVRRGFTLLELFVVVGIILALVSLSLVAVLKTQNYQQRRNTETEISKLDQAVQRRMKRVIDIAKSETPHPIAQTLSNGDPRRAQVIHVLMSLKREFPTSFQEAINPVPTVGNFQGFAANQAIVRALPPGATWATTYSSPEKQASVCLYLTLKLSSRGGDFDPDTGLSSQEVFSDSNGAKMILDAWGNPISFMRWPVAINWPTPSIVYGTQQFFSLNNPPDKEDPEGMLDSNWWLWVQQQPQNTNIALQASKIFSNAPGAYPWAVSTALYPVPTSGGQQYLLTPVIYSAGSDGTLWTRDDIYNFQLNP
jgi:type II secretory pathway pseudopilin PulG